MDTWFLADIALAVGRLRKVKYAGVDRASNRRRGNVGPASGHHKSVCIREGEKPATPSL